MKYIYSIIISVLLVIGAMAQTPTNRTVTTVIADVLAQLPADNQNRYNELMKDLAETGEEGILALVKQINAPGKGSNALVDYALSGITHYAATNKNEPLRTKIATAYVKALKSTDIKEAKQFLIGQLQIIGKDEAVDAIAPLLNNPELSDNAARALASIKTGKAGQALKNALSQRMGTVETQSNIVLAIGEARVEGAENLLTGLLSTDNESLKKDVLYALSRVGNAASLKNLYTAAETKGFGYDKTNATEAYIVLLKNLISNGYNAKMAESAVKDLLKKATKAQQNHTRIAALEMLINLNKTNSLKIVQTALKDTSIAYRNAALNAFSEYADDKSYIALLKTADKSKLPAIKTDIYNWIGREAQSPDKKAKISVLETGIEKTAVGDMIKQLNNSNFDVKQAVAYSLVSIGNEQAIPALAGLLTSNDPKVVDLGKNVLSTFKGNISPAIVKALASAPDKGKVAITELLAQRKSSNYLNTVLDLTKTGSPEVKTAAYTALKDVVGEKDETILCGMLESSDKSAVAPLQQALVASLSSLPKAQQAETVIRRMYQAGDAKKYLYYQPLATTGDSKALKMITDGFADGGTDAKDAAFDALLSWEGPEAAEQLLAICKNPSASNYFDRAIAAYIKKVSNPALTGENRLTFLRKAMDIAKTDAQKNDILKQVSRTGTFLGLLYAGEFLDSPALKENAAQAVMNIALDHSEYTGNDVVALLQKASAALNNPDADYQRQSIKKHLDEMPDEQGFVSIFNGKDLTGWKGLLASPNDNPLKRAKLKPAELAKLQAKADEQMRNDWIVENGLLAFVGKGFDNLCTEKQYGDIEMYVEWMLDPAGPEADAGIYLRGTPQVQIWDTARYRVGAQVGSGGLYNNKVHESKPLKVADNKLGEWNTMYIKMIGDHVTVRLNGELVTDNIILENYWDRNLPIPAVEQLELQAHGSKVYYRNIYVKELERPKPFELSAEEKKEGYKILFDGTNMHEWTGNLVDYTLEGGNISVDPQSNFGGNLYTKDEYANFVFRFEFQLTPAANNGVGIRAPMEGDNAYNAMEIQILDCEHPVYKDIKDYQHHGSIYGVVAAKHGAMKPVGEWNEEEIMADGDHIKVTLNGVVIVDANIREAAKDGTADHQDHPGLFNKSGHIGFLGHGSPLKFRNIRIKTLK